MSHLEKKIIKGHTYYYIIKKKWDKKKKNSVKVSQICLGSAESIEGRIINPKPKKAHARWFGDVFSVYSTMVELGIDKLIDDLPFSKKESKILQLSIINRAAHPTSKNKMSSWFEKTSLFKIYSLSKKELESFNYTRLMKKVSDNDIEKVLATLLQTLRKLGVDTKDIILDNTNYTTRLQKNVRLNLPQLGKSKDGKTGCLQINIHMIVTKDGKMPLYYSPYQGNINDPTFFKMNREKLLKLGEEFKTNNKKVTISIDAGHNSEDNVKAVDSKYNFIGTLRPSMCKDLIEKPSSEFTKTIKLHDGECIRIYSEKRKVYGKEYTLVVSQFSATQRKSAYTLDDNTDRIIHNIKLFEQDLNATFKAEEEGLKKRKTKFHDINKIKSHVTELIKKKKYVKEILTPTIRIANNRISIELKINQRRQEEIKDQLGRAIRFTNRDDFSPEEIVEYYRGQYMVEHQFRDLKSPYLTSIMPMYHHTDETIKTFIFTNYMALLILTYMERKIKTKLKLSIIKDTMLEELRDMTEIMLVFDNKITSIISEKDKQIQEEMYNLFNLEKYYQLPI
ncbi:MAG: IS1634 family transposase [Nanoarchaeota archaeon]|nr:IS1634 family transposase [Nanoarchaeota archaeon]